jgi:hypothetical protein
MSWNLCLILFYTVYKDSKDIIKSVSRILAIWIYLWWFDFGLDPTFNKASFASKFKSGQNWLKNINLASLI